jgi:hypothetical protein
MKEQVVQAQICTYLASRKVFFHSVPNEGSGNNKLATMRLITMGLRPGAPDLVVWWSKGSSVLIGYIEVKNEKGKLSASQVKFQKRCNLCGIPHLVARSVSEVSTYMAINGFHGAQDFCEA